MNGLVNWKALHQLMSPPPGGNDTMPPSNHWDISAESYDGMTKLETAFTRNQVDQFILDPNDSVADIGCGPGRLSVPIARKVKQVTAVDASPKMLEKCIENANREKISNITPKLLNWRSDDAWEKVGKHDVAIAARSVGLSDLGKINKIARKYVFLVNWAGGPNLREIQLDFLAGITEEKKPKGRDNRMFGYNILFNILYDLGVNPNVVIVDDGFTRHYPSRHAAYEDLRFVGDIPTKYEEKYRENVDRYLTEDENGACTFLRKTKTFVMWWKPDEFPETEIG